MSALLLTAQNARGSRQFVTQQPYFGATLVSTAGAGLFRGLPIACQTQNRELVFLPLKIISFKTSFEKISIFRTVVNYGVFDIGLTLHSQGLLEKG